MPGCVARMRVGQDATIGLGVLAPQLAIVEVFRAELPVLLAVCEPVGEASLLLVARDVEQELEDDDVVRGQHGFERVDVGVAGRPHLLGHAAVYAGHQDVLVVRPVEDADHAEVRHLLVDAPEEIMVLLELGGRLEARHVAALWIDRAEHLANGAVLAGGIATLEHDQQCVACVGVEHVLEGGDTIRVLLGLALEVVPGERGADVGVRIIETNGTRS